MPIKKSIPNNPNHRIRLAFSLTWFLTDSIIFLAMWLVLFLILRIFTYFCSKPALWELGPILIQGAIQDITGFLVAWIPWSAVQFVFQRRWLARYCALFVLIIASLTGFLNAVFVAWSHQPLDHTFITYLQDIGSFSSSGSQIMLSWPLRILLGILAMCLLVLAWWYGRQLKKSEFRINRRWLAFYCVAIAILALLNVSSYYCNKEIRPDKHAEAITKNFFLHESLFMLKRGIFLSNLSKHITGDELSLVADIRNTLISDQGHYKFLDSSLPIKKYNISFSKGGRRKGIWNRTDIIRPNIVIIFMESFRSHDIGAYGSSKGLTPFFDSLAEEGWLWENFYANGIQTPRGALAALCSLYPYLGPSIQRSRPDSPLLGLGSILKEHGYKTEFFHNGSLAFDKKIPFFSNLGFDVMMGMRELDPDSKFGHYGWGFPDVPFAEILANRLNSYKLDDPLLLVAFTVSHHHPWAVPDSELKVVKEEGSDEYLRFQNSIHYSDHALGVFFKNLSKDVLERTIFFITADTAQPMGEHYNNFALLSYLYEENVRIPLLVYAPGFIKEGRRFSEISSQVDIMPTILDMLDVKSLNHALGRSLLSISEQPFAHFSNPYFKGWAGMRVGRYKYMHQIEDGRDFLFDLEADPQEMINLDDQNVDLVKILKEITLKRIGYTNYLIDNGKVWLSEKND
ncbi:sulfatase-like hydrolase/transferase [Thermoproteota archaeon]